MDLKHDSEGGENDASVVNSNSIQSFKRPSGTKVSTSSPSQSGQRRSSSRERFSDVRQTIIFYLFFMLVTEVLFYRQAATVVRAEGIL